MKNVLVGVAGDERSDEAVVAGLSLAKRFGAKLELVHAVAPTAGHWLDLSREVVRFANDDARRIAGEAITAHLRTRRHEGMPLELAGTPVQELLRIEIGKPAKVLIDRASALEASILVLGSHRRGGLLEFGTTARTVLAKSPCPVWVQNGWAREIRHVLAPIDLSAHSLAALATARTVAERFDAKLTTLYCFVSPAYVYSLDSGAPMVTAIEHVDELRGATRTEYSKRMESYDWQGVRHEALFVEEDPVRGILAHQDEVDLICMGTHGVTGLAAAVLGSTAYGVLRSARTAVLVLPHPERDYRL
jgi:nucleotide-binding universal stress UspA family protein